MRTSGKVGTHSNDGGNVRSDRNYVFFTACASITNNKEAYGCCCARL